VTQEESVIVVRVLAALVVGASIGFERTFHGRPAGFRTHALVCLASSLLMLVTVYQNQWMTVVPLDAIRTDPTRMAQGIMTGIGFLGAGVIFKEGLTAPPRPSRSWRPFGSSSDVSPRSSTRTIR
jgi:putative Mg2+ transporter-C (MgtC) family protein